jgi:hypothetical protein
VIEDEPVQPRLGWVTPHGGDPIPVRFVATDVPGRFVPVTGSDAGPVAIDDGCLVEVDTIAPGQSIVSGI